MIIKISIYSFKWKDKHLQLLNLNQILVSKPIPKMANFNLLFLLMATPLRNTPFYILLSNRWKNWKNWTLLNFFIHNVLIILVHNVQFLFLECFNMPKSLVNLQLKPKWIIFLIGLRILCSIYEVGINKK